MAPIHSEFVPIAILSALSLLLPLPWHWRARNVATLAIIAWLFVCNIIYAVDALIWGDNVTIVAQVWCDITTKLILGASFALPAACLCICIHLERVASGRLTKNTFADRQWRRRMELGMCFGIPVVFMLLHFIIQGHRYDIIEGYGCRAATYFSIPALFIIWIPPIILSSVAIVFASLALRHFIVRRLSFAAHLHNSSSALTPSRYLRLMTMAVLQMVWSITATVYALAFASSTERLRPWTTWDDVHSDWLRVDVFLDAPTPLIIRNAFYVLWWIIPISTFLFVAFFSFGKDAMDEYKKFLTWLLDVIRLNQPIFIGKQQRSNLTVEQSISKKNLEQPCVVEECSTELTLTAYSCPSTPTRTPAKRESFPDDNESEMTQCVSIGPHDLFKQAEAIGSYGNLSIRPPTTTAAAVERSQGIRIPGLVPEEEMDASNPRSIFPLPISNPRHPLDLDRARLTSRPVTFPSFDASHRGIYYPKPS